MSHRLGLLRGRGDSDGCRKPPWIPVTKGTETWAFRLVSLGLRAAGMTREGAAGPGPVTERLRDSQDMYTTPSGVVVVGGMMVALSGV